MVPLAGRLLSPPPPGSGGQVNQPPPRGAGWRPEGGGSSPRRSTTPPPFPLPPCPLPLHAAACIARNAPAPPHTAVAVACRRCCSCATGASGKKTTENTQNERVHPLLAGCGQERGEGDGRGVGGSGREQNGGGKRGGRPRGGGKASILARVPWWAAWASKRSIREPRPSRTSSARDAGVGRVLGKRSQWQQAWLLGRSSFSGRPMNPHI